MMIVFLFIKYIRNFFSSFIHSFSCLLLLPSFVYFLLFGYHFIICKIYTYSSYSTLYSTIQLISISNFIIISFNYIFNKYIHIYLFSIYSLLFIKYQS